MLEENHASCDVGTSCDNFGSLIRSGFPPLRQFRLESARRERDSKRLLRFPLACLHRCGQINRIGFRII